MDQDPDLPGDMRDLDVVAFQQRLTVRWFRGRRAVLVIVATLLAGGLVGGAVAVSLRSGTQVASKPLTTTVTITKPPPSAHPSAYGSRLILRPPEHFDPTSSYLASCGLQGDEFIATVSFDNRGNVGLAYKVTASWVVRSGVSSSWVTSAGGTVTRTVEEQIAPAGVVTVQAHAPATPAEIAANRSIARTHSACTVLITPLSSFGNTYR